MSTNRSGLAGSTPITSARTRRSDLHHLTLRRVAGDVPVSVQGTLALDFQPLLNPPEISVLPGQASSDRIALPHDMRTRLEQWTHRHLQAVVEIAAGDRPASQLVRWCIPTVHQNLTRRALLASQAGGHVAGCGRVSATVRPHVLSIRLQMVAQDAFEACAHVRYGNQGRALAARYELRRSRWQAVALEFA